MLATKNGDIGGNYTEVELGVAREENLVRSPSKSKQQDLKWSGVNFRVKDKRILENCWGYLPNGKLMAIMVTSCLFLCLKRWAELCMCCRDPLARGNPV